MDDLAGHKVYFPVESLTGLGHLNRTGKLVREMVKNGLEVTVASGSYVDPQRFFAGADCRNIPPICFNNKGKFFLLHADGTRTIQANFNEAARKEERTQAQVKNVLDTHPDIVVTEFWPFDRPGLDREMEAVIDAAKPTAAKGLRLASVRDVLDTPQESERTPEAEKAHAERQSWAAKYLNENYDAVLIHGDENFIPLNETFAAAKEIKIPVIYTGYVLDDMPKRAIAANDPNAPIVVSCGSGVDGHEMIFSFLTAWDKLLQRSGTNPDIDYVVNRPLHIITGPRFDPGAFEEVTSWTKMLASDYGIEIQLDRYRDDITKVMANAAFSVSLAGYNTTLETLAIETPALLIPKYCLQDGQVKLSTEQLYRLEHLAEKGYASYAHPEDVQNPKKFADILLTEFLKQTREQQKEKPKLNFSGAENTIVAIESLLKKKNAPGAA